MIKVKHPLERCNRTQEETITKLPEAERRFHELMFSYGNAVYRYHQAAAAHEPSHQDYEEWLEGLPLNIARDMAAKGFVWCRTVLSFTRYVQEKNDVGQEEYVRDLMGEEEFEEYRALTA
ncbi:hypothetical protein CLV24_105152 [Pontibacter ummariensis]|uniref:Uncharacterized protein n=1 Tax=Pontibacter ummariensis TaxID=1610492 RepID=A0A239DUJ1_9BACT|nr:hypothetical protein [Pontibacter ummariensis]PRY13782.1 hypothetical protein CLV24_105152 [Pontibacter ummariensis]SNS35234.1 hypothetical protein SAMN06296052_105100 [Pontibacter ummariensis]